MAINHEISVEVNLSDTPTEWFSRTINHCSSFSRACPSRNCFTLFVLCRVLEEERTLLRIRTGGGWAYPQIPELVSGLRLIKISARRLRRSSPVRSCSTQDHALHSASKRPASSPAKSEVHKKKKEPEESAETDTEIWPKVVERKSRTKPLPQQTEDQAEKREKKKPTKET
ncbi:hypothetical protein J6590_073370 [Homalodisca vitripennis]|nr:hypothetical protein J6590_073370 [Homalodisca vitripennis]